MDKQRLERAYRTFVRCHHAVANATSERQLLQDLCSTCVDELGFRLAWIGFTEERTHRIKPAAQAGYEAGYLESLLVTWADDDHGWGPTGRAVRTMQSQVARDIASDDRYGPWRADALERGYASSAAIPLIDHGRAFGVLNLYAEEPDAFDDEELALLEEMAIELVAGIQRLRTARRMLEMQEQVERAARAEIASAVVAAVVHDINNLLQVIALSIDQARATPEKVSSALDEAADATSSAAQLLRQLLKLTRRALHPADRADVDAVVHSLQPLLARLAPTAKLVLNVGAPRARCAIAPLDVERILINLVVNAAHATPAGGIITITTRRRQLDAPLATETGLLPAGHYVELSVTDSGAGIEPEVLAHIFEPFFTTKGDGGSGLGLTSVLQLARDAHGAVTVESNVGDGTRFAVLLPLVADSPPNA